MRVLDFGSADLRPLRPKAFNHHILRALATGMIGATGRCFDFMPGSLEGARKRERLPVNAHNV